MVHKNITTQYDFETIQRLYLRVQAILKLIFRVLNFAYVSVVCADNLPTEQRLCRLGEAFDVRKTYVPKYN